MRTSLWLLVVLAASCDNSAVSTTGDAGQDGSAVVDMAGGDLAAGGGDLATVDLSLPDAAGPCPNVVGAYSVMASGQGCGTFNANAPQCITTPSTVCDVHFVSAPPAGNGAINGPAMLQPDGSFTGAALLLGMDQRTGCTGTWNAATSTMVVDCGGMGSSQSCVVTLTRTATSCP